MSLQSTDLSRPVASDSHVRFDAKENERLTSFSGLVIFQALFERLDLRQKLVACFEHFSTNRLY